MIRSIQIFSLITVIVILFSSCDDGPQIYYIDSSEGNDAHSGVSEFQPWKSIEKINEQPFKPGDQILFKRGQKWRGTIKPKGSGSSQYPVVIGAYGKGNNPIIHGGAKTDCSPDAPKPHYCTILLSNQEYWIIQDIEITNYNLKEENELSMADWEEANVTNYVDVLHPPQFKEERTKKSGILVLARNYGAVHDLQFSNLNIHGINGNIKTKHNGGIFFDIAGKEGETPTYFDGVLVDSCYIHDVDRTGVSNWSFYDDRTVDSTLNWTPSLNFKISNNRFERTGANAVIMRVADKPIIEYNLFDHCAIKESGNAFFNFNTDSAIMQHNEARFTKYNVGDHDAGGIDSDFRTKGTILQFNYIHDNDFGPLITGGQKKSGGFNTGTIVRFNIFQNDGIIRNLNDGDDRLNFSFKISGNATHTKIHNNIIHLTQNQRNRALIYHRNWGAYPSDSRYFNNIIINHSEGSYLELTKSEENVIVNNVLVGNNIDKWNSVVDSSYTWESVFDSAYFINVNSPAAFVGKPVSMPDLDYYGNYINTQQMSIGIHMITNEE